VSADAATSVDREIFGIDRRKALLTGAAALILAVAAVVGIGQVTSFHHVTEALKQADPVWFPVCLGESSSLTPATSPPTATSRAPNADQCSGSGRRPESW
jgi:hypothetical protein